MSDVLWGFVGTIVGGFVTLVATWLQQRHSAAREELAFERAEKERRRAFEERVLVELRELLVIAASELQALRVSYAAKMFDRAGTLAATWGATHIWMLALIRSVSDESIREAVIDAFEKMNDAIGPIGKQEDEARVHDAQKAAYAAIADAQAAIGARLRELA